jgi:hypothetical protein
LAQSDWDSSGEAEGLLHEPKAGVRGRKSVAAVHGRDQVPLRRHLAVGQDCMPGGTTSGRWRRSASPRASGTASGSSPARSRPCCSLARCRTSSATGGCGSLAHLYQASVPLWMVSDSILALVVDLLDNDKIIHSINDSLA